MTLQDVLGEINTSNTMPDRKGGGGGGGGGMDIKPSSGGKIGSSSR